VAVNDWNGVGVGNTNMMWLNAHQLSEFGVRGVHSEIPLSATALCEEP
jgi:hypothetical protein